MTSSLGLFIICSPQGLILLSNIQPTMTVNQCSLCLRLAKRSWKSGFNFQLDALLSRKSALGSMINGCFVIPV
jgi:hypothetical protein